MNCNRAVSNGAAVVNCVTVKRIVEGSSLLKSQSLLKQDFITDHCKNSTQAAGSDFLLSSSMPQCVNKFCATFCSAPEETEPVARYAMIFTI
jgi:hypothetical protein